MLIETIESFLGRHAMSAAAFGAAAAQDPRLVRDLRAGRDPRPPLDQRLRGFMAGYDLARTLPPANRRTRHAR